MQTIYRIKQDFNTKWLDKRCSTGFRAVKTFSEGWMIILNEHDFSKWIKVVTPRGAFTVDYSFYNEFKSEMLQHSEPSESMSAHEKIHELGISDYNLDSLIQMMIDLNRSTLEDIEIAYNALQHKWSQEDA